ncbi:MAG: hypothetical protein GF370_04425 [Candidatus Nealsonbacteria bacterium]|nr:hypothetical protein [Candidatus Nealsonbacteria bacterium]
MNLPVACSSKENTKEKGITLLEMMIVMVILVFLMSPLVPIAMDFYYARQFDLHLQNIIQSLRRAQLKSMYSEAESRFGVYFGDREYILFKGDSYADRDPEYDEVSDLPSASEILGMEEIVFSRGMGLPSDVGDIYFSFDERSATININSHGVLDY